MRVKPMPGGESQQMWFFDVYVEDRHIVVEGDLPGFESEDLTVLGGETRVVLSGTRRHRVRGRDRTYFNRERRLATLHREIPLPQRVEADAAEVTLRHGVLRVRMPLARPDRFGPCEVRLESA
jgi:HSP20 family protein